MFELVAIGGRRREWQSVLMAVMLFGSAVVGCAGGGKPAEACIVLSSSPNLNSFDGQPHVVVVSMFPLQNISAFQTTDPLDLLNGVRPPGTTGDPWEVTVYPGVVKEIEEKLPRDTVYVGLVADFYRGASRAVVEASCPTLGFGGIDIVLSSKDLQVK